MDPTFAASEQEQYYKHCEGGEGMSEVDVLKDEAIRARWRLAMARKSLANARAVLEFSRAEWEVQNAVIIGELEKAQAEQAEADIELRALTLQLFEATGDKAPLEGLGVREMTRLDYAPSEAVLWAAKAGLYGVLKLDVRKFEKVARPLVDDLAWLGEHTEAVATVAEKLPEEG